MDIGVLNGKIVDIEDRAVDVDLAHDIDAEGCLVLPGLIDHHVHVFGKGSGLRIDHPDLLLCSGVTGVVDAGSSGCAAFESFYQTAILNSRVKTKCYLNAFSGGQLDFAITENFDPGLYNEKSIARLRERYPDVILGLKLRTSRSVVKGLGIRPLLEIKAMCGRFGGLPLCVHVTDPPFPMQRLAEALDTGDIFCHMYGHGKETLVGPDKKVISAVREARERGVVFDSANGRNNFSFVVARPAIADGFIPDIISTDVTREKLHLPPHVKNLPSLMSKYLMLGCPLENVAKMVTETPARMMGMEGRIGTLSPGAFADIAILQEIQKTVIFEDSQGERMTGHKLLITKMTISDGEVVYSAGEFHV
jgi:predicted amidohydrolase